MKTKQARTINRKKVRSRWIGVMLALGLVIIVVILVFLGTAEDRKVVQVVRLKHALGANQLITEDDVEAYDMYYKEYISYATVKFKDGKRRSVIINWKDKDAVLGKRYAAYYLRGKTLLFWDSTVKEQTKKNSYLYSIKGELLNLQLNTDDFGNMAVPGDRLNVRVTYDKTNYDLMSEDEYKLMTKNGGSASAVTLKTTEPLFKSVPVLDMLNSDGNSIFDIYYAYISKTPKQQAELLKNSEFIKSVKPESVLVEATAEEVDHYAEIQSKSPQYLLTLLPRTGSNSIIDSLGDIQDAVRKASQDNVNK